MYSKKDALVSWQAIHEHAREASRAGHLVTNVLFNDSAHVQHAKANKRLYWKIIQDAWQTANNSTDRLEADDNIEPAKGYLLARRDRGGRGREYLLQPECVWVHEASVGQDAKETYEKGML